MDAVSDRDFACEFLSAAALVGMHLSRLSEDVILWAIERVPLPDGLSDAFTTGSSLMPQKKNPGCSRAYPWQEPGGFTATCSGC